MASSAGLVTLTSIKKERETETDRERQRNRDRNRDRDRDKEIIGRITGLYYTVPSGSRNLITPNSFSAMVNAFSRFSKGLSGSHSS